VCCRCKAAGGPTGEQTAQPWQLHSFPATPVHSLEPATAPATYLPVWFDLQLLALYSRLRLEVAQLAEQAWVKTLLTLHQQNGCTAVGAEGQLKADTLRKQLGAAAAQYQLLDHRRLEKVRQAAQAEQPDQLPQPDCPACAAEPHSLYADCNMKQTHLRLAAGATQRQPQAQRRLLPDADVKDFLNSDANDISAALPDTCNDFDADSILSRSSRKNDITGA